MTKKEFGAVARKFAGAGMGLAAVVAVSGAARAQEPAESADAFVERMGVCTEWGNAKTPYATSYRQVAQLLGELGIRHVRDRFDAGEIDLYHRFGVKTTVVFEPTDVKAAVKTVGENLPSIDSVEGPDDVDVSTVNATYAGAGFPEGPRHFQKALFDALKEIPATKKVDVIAPSVARASSARQLGPLEGFDFLAASNFGGGGMPSLVVDGTPDSPLTAAFSLVGPNEILKPVVVPSAGYHTALAVTASALGGTQTGVSEQVQAKYLLRLVANDFQAGIAQTFVKELVDDAPDGTKEERDATNAEACYGIIRHDLTPKPAYAAMKNLIGILSERTWKARTRQWIWEPTADTPRTGVVQYKMPVSLNFTLAGKGVENVRHVLLQKQTGDFYLLLWQEVPSFNAAKKADIAVPAVPVTLTLKTPFRGGSVYDPTTSATEPTQIFGPSPNAITVAVPDSVIVVQITPEKPWPEKPLLTHEDHIAVQATATTVHVTWLSYQTAPPVGYFISRNGQYIGRTTEPSFDDSGLRPATGYPYTIRAYEADGSVGPAVGLIATTQAAAP